MRKKAKKRGRQRHQSRIAFARPTARFEEQNAGSGNRTPVAWLEARSRAARPIPRSHHDQIRAEGEGVEPSRLIARPISNRVPSPFGLPFRISHRVDRRGVEPRFPGCRPGVVPLDQQPIFISTGGSRTHRHQPLELIAMPVRVPCHQSHRLDSLSCSLRARDSNRGIRAYETRPSTSPPACPRPRYRAG